MVSVFIGSTEEYSGKTLICLGLGKKLREDGFEVGYFKPIGRLPTTVGGVTVDADAVFMTRMLDLEEPLEEISPVLLTQDVLARAYSGDASGLRERILKAYSRLSEGRDVMIIGGTGSLADGAVIGMPGPVLAEDLDAQVLLVDGCRKEMFVDDLLMASQWLAERSLGVVLNTVAPARMGYIRERIVPFLASRGVEVLGIMPRDMILSSVSIRQLCEAISGEVLCCPEALDDLVENFSVGAMALESALRHFRRVRDKAVITGGDRSDIQLAALDTDTKCLILTGGLYPNEIIRGRAEELSVPILVVHTDTLETVLRVERVLRHSAFREPERVARAIELVKQEVAFGRLYEKLGVR